MNKALLSKLLERLGVHPTSYSLEPTPLSEGVVLDRTARGWEVSFRERGQASAVRQFGTEDDACWEVLQCCVKWLLLSDRLGIGDVRGGMDPIRDLYRGSKTHLKYVIPQHMDRSSLALLLDRLGVDRASLVLGCEDTTAQFALWDSPHGWVVRTRDPARPSMSEDRFFSTESDACWTLARWLIDDAAARREIR